MVFIHSLIEITLIEMLEMIECLRLLKLFEKRKSVREYREKAIAPDVMGEVIGFIDNLPAGIEPLKAHFPMII